MNPEPIEEQIKLYALMVDQLHKHNTTIWQFPTAILAVNVLALPHIQSLPLATFVLIVLNSVLVYSMFRVIRVKRFNGSGAPTQEPRCAIA